MSSYRERLWPAAWMYVVVALAVPATMLVFAPISLVAGISTAIVIVGGCLTLLFLASPLIIVDGGWLQAGRARIEIAHLGSTRASRADEARRARGQELDARAHLMLRGWVDPVLRVEVRDEDDPAPYWLLSTRRPEELAAAIDAARVV
jgi:hypothetical protein